MATTTVTIRVMRHTEGDPEVVATLEWAGYGKWRLVTGTLPEHYARIFAHFDPFAVATSDGNFISATEGEIGDYYLEVVDLEADVEE